MSQLEFEFSPQPPDAPAPTPRVPSKQAPAPLQAALPEREYLQARGRHLLAELIARTGLQIQLHINDNRSTVMSVKYHRDGRSARVGLHHMFLRAEGALLDALAHWVKHPRSRRHAAALNTFIREHNHLLAAKKDRPLPVRTRGRVYDLQKLYDEVNAAHFGGRVNCPITWGRMPPPGRRRSIRFGSYTPRDHIIRMHPLLDQEAVPEFFIRFIVFHEMLHADLGVEEGEGRRVIHSKAFRAIEQTHPDYDAAETWMKRSSNLAMLLGRKRPRAGA